MLTDPIADYLTRIRNALARRARGGRDPRLAPEAGDVAASSRSRATSPTSRSSRRDVGEVIRIELSYTEDRDPVISGMERVSRPGRRRYVDHDEVPRVHGGMGTAIVSTSSGVMTGHEAKQQGRRRRGRRLRLVSHD